MQIRVRCGVFGASIVMATSLGAASDLAGLARTIDSPRMGRVLRISEPIRLGRGAITLAPGTFVRELLAGDTPCGIAIQGASVLTYRVEDRFSQPVAERNIRSATRLSPVTRDGVLVVEADLEAVAIWGWDLECLSAPGDEPPAAGQAGLPSWARAMLDRPFFSHPSRSLLSASRNGGHGTVYALLKGKKPDLLLSVDPGENRMEVLYRIDEVDDVQALNHGRHFLEDLAAQPVGRQWWDRAPEPLVAVAETISVDNDHDEHVTVTTETVLQATRPSVGLWRVDLIDRRVKDRKILPNTVVSVTVNGRPAQHLHQDSELLVALEPAVRSGQKVTVKVVNQGDLALRPGGDSYWSLGTWPWYPQPSLNGEFATIDLMVRVPKPFTPFASGATVSKEEDGEHTVLHTRLDKPMQLPVVAAGKYHVVSETRDGVTCNVASYVFGKKSASGRLINNFYAAAEFYTSIFGVPFPFTDFNVVEVNEWGFGQAPPGMIFITREAFEPLTDTMNQYFARGVNERYVHEVAHAWWGHVFKMDSPEEQWLTESFAEYSAALCLEAMKGGGKKGRREFDAIVDGWRARARGIGDGGSIYLANYLAGKDAKDWEDRRYLLYSKGPLVLHAVRLELGKHFGGQKEGDRAFVTLLQALLKNFSFKWGSTKHLLGILSQMTGEDWQPWFERYVYGCEMPPIK